MAATIIYGWEEQSGAQWGVLARRVDCELTVHEDGAVFGEDVPEGEWFRTFAIAKAKAIEYWENDLAVTRQALSEVRKLRKADVKP